MRTTTVIIGAGHAGLAMSRCLSEHGVDHVVLERGEVANSWRRERWDSLTLLTPNWQSRLPGFGYEGDDPDGYRSMPEVIDFIGRYAQAIDAPVRTGTTVTSVRRRDDGYLVETDQGPWEARAVVMASGACNVAVVPGLAAELDGVDMIHSFDYKNPDQVADGGVLVVGASATGTQIADELQKAGRQVTIAVGEHVRAPRVYRGRDIEWWMDATGRQDERYDEVDDVERVRHTPSIQLTGTADRSTLDLNALTDIGVELIGKLAGVNGSTLQFSGSLPNKCSLADLKMGRLLTLIDEWATEQGLDGEVGAPERFEPTRVPDPPPLMIDLDSGRIKTIVWATGYRPDYSWLDIDLLDAKGRVRHDGGVVTESPGLYLMGIPFLRRRKSTLIDGAGDDARELSAHLVAHLGGQSAAAS